jgi:proteasome lid subunit RPN8/RPN11
LCRFESDLRHFTYSSGGASVAFVFAMQLILTQAQVADLRAHAREVAPEECCGLLGGAGGAVRSVYRLTNAARQPLTSYEASPAELFAAQRAMRERGEELLGIYHSHPRQAAPAPSATDVRLAFYPSAVYFIVGLGGVVNAFRLDEAAGSWSRIEYAVEAE